jgi:hypothetical protein
MTTMHSPTEACTAPICLAENRLDDLGTRIDARGGGASMTAAAENDFCGGLAHSPNGLGWLLPTPTAAPAPPAVDDATMGFASRTSEREPMRFGG